MWGGYSECVASRVRRPTPGGRRDRQLGPGLTPSGCYLERFLPPELFLPPRLRGTLAPFFLASESPIAIACLRLFTVLPLLPDLSVPFLRRRIALSTRFDAALPYFLPPEDFLAAITLASSKRGSSFYPDRWLTLCHRGLYQGVHRPPSLIRHDKSNGSGSRSHQSTHRRSSTACDSGNSHAMSGGRARSVDSSFENAPSQRRSRRARGDR